MRRLLLLRRENGLRFTISIRGVCWCRHRVHLRLADVRHCGCCPRNQAVILCHAVQLMSHHRSHGSTYQVASLGVVPAMDVAQPWPGEVKETGEGVAAWGVR